MPDGAPPPMRLSPLVREPVQQQPVPFGQLAESACIAPLSNFKPSFSQNKTRPLQLSSQRSAARITSNAPKAKREKQGWKARLLACFVPQDFRETGRPGSGSEPVVAEAIAPPEGDADEPTQPARISSHSSKSFWPKSWEEFGALYSTRKIDLNDPPGVVRPGGVHSDSDYSVREALQINPQTHSPVLSKSTSLAKSEEQNEPSPLELGFYCPPAPADERFRQRAVNRLLSLTRWKRSADAPMIDEPIDQQDLTEQQLVKSVAAAKKQTRLSYRKRREAKARTRIESTETPSALATTPTVDQVGYSNSLEDHPAFRSIVAHARATFNTKISLLTILDDDKQLFLAESGLGGMQEIPRSVSFCNHTILSNPGQGFVLLDTEKDWRSAKAPLTLMGNRFYAGVPLLAPNFNSATGDDMAIGTLCVVDDKPRTDFSLAERHKLGELAEYARLEIEVWYRERMDDKLSQMQRRFKDWKSVHRGSTGYRQKDFSQALTRKRLDPVTESEGASHPPTPDEHLQPQAIPDLVLPDNTSYTALARPDDFIARPITPEVPAAAPVSVESSAPDSTVHSSSIDEHEATSSAATSLSGQRSVQASLDRVYSLALRIIGETLDMSMVYLCRLDLAQAPAQGPLDTTPYDAHFLNILASWGMPTPKPIFDPVLHLKALRGATEGTLYSNPRLTEMTDGEFLPRFAIATTMDEPTDYKSAILLPIAKHESEKRGYLLCAYHSDAKRVFGAEDLSYMRDFALELASYVETEDR
ncbi:uncharacterized protein L969DRAFT_64890 [Mixia osmundae IAM 14324]|uniref:GAF domain-containing protein n=1 Tax=Mixia osmundae (strain CBS 9802 / IAM 14324 / JCM 22182 / KY 12970) TaxID=764103 RepID=G7DX20_MIXOS|nr:uncharacterized protein L969DRAFT_64890 [Mixia osmundae IAM 14324]KEI38074.1 hypothetical protein L969DRAFT_64890 [Mixia osmundae IAM 14324]GAA95117.1 hypothetical protein E5Q_01772 [Mixia osmundae IAM 14324]